MSAAASTPGILGLGQIAIRARDLPRATAFYREVLGLRFLFAAGNMAFFDCGGVRLLLGPAESPEFDHPSSILYFRVPEIQSAWRTLLGHGVEALAEPRLIARMPDHDLWMAAFRDSEGNILELMSESPRSG